MGGGLLHRLVDVPGPYVQRAAEQAGEAHHVVDLVGMVAAAGAHHGSARRQGIVRLDFGSGVCHGEHDSPGSHGLHHFFTDDMGRADADEHVRALHGVGKLSGELFGVGDLRHFFLGGVHLLALAQHAETVHHL